MALFALWRHLDHTLGEDERKGMTIRSIGATAEHVVEPVRWVRSYVIDEPGRLQSLCVYEGPSARAVVDLQLLCAIPFEEIEPVVELRPPSTASGPGDLYLAWRDIPRGATEPAVAEDNARASGEAEWVRSYWDSKNALSWCVYRAETRNGQSAAVLPRSFRRVESVAEVHPSEWAWVYETFGLPRHWELNPDWA
ncbi:MAG: nickel-binding protein [Dehalococcoidia bacterium]